MSMCNVIGLLEDNEEQMWSTVEAAVALADAENARLTLAKTCEPGRWLDWMSPFGCGGAFVPPHFDSPDAAARLLAQAAESVPAWIPVTTVLLGADTRKSLRTVLQRYPSGAVVTGPKLLARCRLLGRDLRRMDIQVTTVEPKPQPAASMPRLRSALSELAPSAAAVN